MIVYWDLLILSTIIVNYAFIRTIAMLLNDRLKVYRVILALIVSVLMLLLYFLPYKTYYAIRYIMGVLVGLIAFSNKSIKIKIIVEKIKRVMKTKIKMKIIYFYQ